jgi:hypothetical protein
MGISRELPILNSTSMQGERIWNAIPLRGQPAIRYASQSIAVVKLLRVPIVPTCQNWSAGAKFVDGSLMPYEIRQIQRGREE